MKVRLLLLLILPLLLIACDKDHFATGAGDQPELSTDTLAMGRLLGNNSSKTYLLKLYNRCDADLRLESISLRHAGQSGFRMNVDGMNGTSFTNSELLRIAQDDSMFVFVEATFDIEPDDPLQINHTDYIDIVCNGRTQTIVLTATSLKVEQLRNVVISADTTWTGSGLNKQILDSLIIMPGATLTLADSVILYMHDKAGIRVAGTLLCLGSDSAGVTLRGDRTDNLFYNLSYDQLPSQWGTLQIDSTARGCRFEHTDIHGLTAGILIDSTDVRFESCRISSSDDNLITCHMSDVVMHNCLLYNAAGALLDIYGGRYSVVHCTLANFNFNSAISRQTLCISNMDANSGRYTPLDSCTLVNTIVWGRSYDPDMSLSYYKVAVGTDPMGNTEWADSVFNYHFDHCLLRADGTDDNDFIATLWNIDPEFVLTDLPTYSFDFHLQATSPAIGAGSAEGAQLCPTDLDGNARAAVPSIGCFEGTKAP